VKEVLVLSSEWPSVELGELYDFSSGLSKSSSEFGHGSPFLSFVDVFYNYTTPEILSGLVNSTEKEREKASVERGDVFLTRTSETVSELGMSCVALKDYPNATFNGFTKRLRPKKSDVIHPEYAAYFFRSVHFRWQVYAMSSISTRASLNNAMLNKLKIILPPIPIQKKIGSTLNSLDELRGNFTIISNILSSQIELLFRSWFIDFDPVKAKVDGKLQYGMDEETAALFPDALEDSELGPIPVGWEISKLTNIAKVTMGTSPKGETYCNLDEGVMPLLNGAADFDGQNLTPNQDTTAPTTIAKALDFVFCIRATIGNLTIADRDYCIGRCVASAREINAFDRTFLYCNIGYLLRTWKWNAIGSVIVGVSGPEVKNSSIVLPPQSIRRAFEKAVKEQMKLIDILHDSQASLSTCRDVLLPRLMSGELEI
jgi:type I restriction enzyme, S subunit